MSHEGLYRCICFNLPFYKVAMKLLTQQKWLEEPEESELQLAAHADEMLPLYPYI